jgi:anti-sigma-K factor RskA
MTEHDDGAVIGHETWDELAAGYALHGLSDHEEVLFLVHLDGCAECTDSVRDHEMVAAQLGSIAHYRDSDNDAPSWESMRAAVIGDGSPAVVDLASRRRRYDVSRRSLAAAAAVVVVAGGGIVTWQTVSGGGHSDCSASQGCHIVQLDASTGDSLASLVVRNNHATVTPTNMPAAPTGETYVLWQLAKDHRPAAISEFRDGTGGPAGHGTLDVPYADTQQFAISLEPASVTPPTTPSGLLASGLAS